MRCTKPLWTALFLTALSLLLSPVSGRAEPPGLVHYLPAGADYDATVPPPPQVLGTEVGEWHVRHDQLVRYMETVAGASDRVALEITGHTHEDRPVLLLTVTSPENHARLEELRLKHLELSNPESRTPVAPGMPAVVWLCYSVHGNESSGANAALLAVYHLAAAEGREMEELLANTIILIDPVLNPDGLDRFAGWANRYRGRVLNPDPEHLEHNESWPSGRTNHYWFDLNRDWLLQTHPESRARVRTYHRWRPNILCDFHEMGTNSTYFFQPGVPSRKHPLTPERNVALTARIATYHARFLDADSRLYYSEEVFDDFYYGKGSTYPDANGCIGILFEQASARGHLQDSHNGPVSFPFTIKGQFLTTLSTLEAARDLRGDLLEYQRDFYRSGWAEAARGPETGWVFGDAHDRGRTQEMLRVLRAHDIRVRELAREVTADGETFRPGSAYVVQARQPQARLARALFETRTSFPDSIFYDVSSWTLPLSFGVPYAALTKNPRSLLGTAAEASLPIPQGVLNTSAAGEAYAVAVEWNEYYAPRTLNRLLEAGARVRVATRPFTGKTADGSAPLPSGTMLIPLGIQDVEPEVIFDLVARGVREDGLKAHSLVSGLTPTGIDLGSPSLEPLTLPRPLLVTGPGVSAYEAGEVWHLLDHRMEMRCTLVPRDDLPGVDLSDYTHLLLVNGSYSDWDSATVESLQGWVRGGGVLVATKNAARWAADQGFSSVKVRNSDEPDDTEKKKEKPPVVHRAYADHDRDAGARFTSGAIFRAEVDITHPLAFGYTRARLPVFKNSNLFFDPVENPYATVVRLARDPLWSGYIHPENLRLAPGAASVTAERYGRGTVVLFAENPNFRGVWYGTNRLYLNALFLGSAVGHTGE